MKKHLLLAAAMLGLALPNLPSAALADPPEHASGHHPEITAQDAAAFTNARIAALKAGLELTPAQEKNWPGLEAALRDIAKARAQRAAEWREKHEKRGEDRGHRDVIEGLRQGGKALSSRAAELEKLADAAKPLYDSLDDAQKRRFGVLLRAASRMHGHHGHAGGSHDGDQGRDG